MKTKHYILIIIVFLVWFQWDSLMGLYPAGVDTLASIAKTSSDIPGILVPPKVLAGVHLPKSFMTLMFTLGCPKF